MIGTIHGGRLIAILTIPLIIGTLIVIRHDDVGLEKAFTVSGPFPLEETEPLAVLVAVEGRNR